MAGALGWAINELYKIRTTRQKIIRVVNTAITPYKLPQNAPEDLKIEFKGKPLSAIYENTFVLSNQSFETIASPKVIIRLDTNGGILHTKIEDKISTRTSKSYVMGKNQIVVKIDYLNSFPVLKDKIKVIVLSESPIQQISVTGGGEGWGVAYSGTIEEGPVIVSLPTSKAFVAVDGPIGVGKTTLAKLMSEKWNADLIRETFEENPYLPLILWRS